MRTVAVIQARTGSTRLPGKVLLPLSGAPALQRMVERVRQAQRLDEVIVATTTLPGDDAVVDLCAQLGVPVARGSDADVLGRLAGAVREYATDAGYVVRLTGDCPLIDPTLIDEVVSLATANHATYASNVIPPTWPDGLDCEVLSWPALARAEAQATSASDREHVTPWILRSLAPEQPPCVTSPVDLSGMRWTLDEAEDYVLIAAVYGALYRQGRSFLTSDILDYLGRRPEIAAINRRFRRNEGYRRPTQEEMPHDPK